MKKLLSALALLALFGGTDHAQASDVYRPNLIQHGDLTANALATTNSMARGVVAVRITCEEACYYAFAVTNGTSVKDLETTGHIKATNSTTAFLPSESSVTHLIGEGEFIIAIQVSEPGEIMIMDMTR